MTTAGPEPRADRDRDRERRRWAVLSPPAIPVRIGAVFLIGAAALFLLDRSFMPAEYFEHDVVFRNKSGGTVRGVRLVGEQRDRPVVTIGEFASVADGEEVRAGFDRQPWFHLRVEVRMDGIGYVWRRVAYIDSDEWGDIDLRLEPGPRLNGERGEAEE